MELNTSNIAFIASDAMFSEFTMYDSLLKQRQLTTELLIK